VLFNEGLHGEVLDDDIELLKVDPVEANNVIAV
jgi:hypothetical protein